MMDDIKRICEEPDRRRPRVVPRASPASGDGMAALRDAWANYRDESFIAQFLSPKLMRDFRLFHVVDDRTEPELRSTPSTTSAATAHAPRAGPPIRRRLVDPDIQVVDVDLAGDRRLILHHHVVNRLLLEPEDASRVLQHLADLWGYDVLLKEIDTATGMVLKEHRATAQPLGR